MKKVVVVGGGFAGAFAAKNLESDFDVTLVDSKDYFEFTPSILRTIVDPEHLSSIQVLHTHYLKSARFLRGHATKINRKSVMLGKKKLPFDYLILASGSRYAKPFKEERVVVTSRGNSLRNSHKQLEKAKSVAIIGGGVVGVELAAEIVEHYPNKKVLLIHGESELMPRTPKKARAFAASFLAMRGTHLVLGKHVKKITKKTVITDDGERYTADVTYSCVGIIPNTEYVSGKHQSTRHGIDVNAFLQLKGQPHVFVCGDVTSIKEEKLAQNAEKQAETVVKNIHLLEAGKPLSKYQSKKRVILISLGQRCGILIHNDFVWCGKVPAFLKQLVEWRTMRRYC